MRAFFAAALLALALLGGSHGRRSCSCGPVPGSVSFGPDRTSVTWSASWFSPTYRKPTWMGVVVIAPDAAGSPVQPPLGEIAAATMEALADEGIDARIQQDAAALPRLRIVITRWPAAGTIGDAMANPFSSGPMAIAAVDLVGEDGAVLARGEVKGPVWSGLTRGPEDTAHRMGKSIGVAVARGRE